MALSQSLPRPAREYGDAQRQEIGAAVAAAARIWSGMGDDLDRSYATIEGDLLQVIDLAQARVSSGAAAYVPQVLAETAPTTLQQAPAYRLDTTSLVGTAGDGMSTNSLAYTAVIRTKTAIGAGAGVEQALRTGGAWLGTAVGTLLSDTGRTVEKVSANARGAGVFVRMLNPPSCGRCVILAGRPTGSQTAFVRHPGCDCRNIPAAEAVADDLTVDPRTYLDSLDDAGLARALQSSANARAYRDGADLNQLVNAYRKGSVRPAQVYRRDVKYTTEGTTRRGVAGWRMQQGAAAKAGRPGTPRLMPESIYQIATSHADAQRLLRRYGWIL